MLVAAAVALPPGIELAGRHAQTPDEPPGAISLASDQRRTKSTIWSRTSCGTQTPVRVPQEIFLRRCAPHQLGQNLVLALNLLLQVIDPFLFGLMVGARLGLEGRRPILEELLLSTVENRRLQPQFVTELGDRLVLQQMAPQNGDLLFGGVVRSRFSHAFSPLS